MNQLATKADLDAFRVATKSDIADFRVATKADLADFRAAIKGDIASLNLRMTIQFLVTLFVIVVVNMLAFFSART